MVLSKAALMIIFSPQKIFSQKSEIFFQSSLIACFDNKSMRIFYSKIVKKAFGNERFPE